MGYMGRAENQLAKQNWKMIWKLGYRVVNKDWVSQNWGGGTCLGVPITTTLVSIIMRIIILRYDHVKNSLHGERL